MLLPAVLWREENISNEVSNLANEVFKQSIADAAWFILDSFSKMWEESDNLEKIFK